MSDSKTQAKPIPATLCDSILFVLTASATIVWTVLFYLFARDEYEYNYTNVIVLLVNGGLLICSFLGARWFCHVLMTDNPVDWFGCTIGVICLIVYITLPFQGIPGICLNISQKGGAFYTPTPLTMLMILHTLGWGLFFACGILFFLGVLTYNFIVCLCCPGRKQIKI